MGQENSGSQLEKWVALEKKMIILGRQRASAHYVSIDSEGNH